MARVVWADPIMSGGLFESVVSCLLGNQHPRSVRVRPSQGDGGVDIVVFLDDGRIDVYQLKFYPGKIDWRKVRASLERLRSGSWMG